MQPFFGITVTCLLLLQGVLTDTGSWGEWEPWSVCNSDYDVRERTRNCLTLQPKCSSSRVDFKQCSNTPELFDNLTLHETVKESQEITVGNMSDCVEQCVQNALCEATTYVDGPIATCHSYNNHSYRLAIKSASQVFLKLRDWVKNVCLKDQYGSKKANTPEACIAWCLSDEECVAVTFQLQLLMCHKFNNSLLVDYGKGCISWFRKDEAESVEAGDEDKAPASPTSTTPEPYPDPAEDDDDAEKFKPNLVEPIDDRHGWNKHTKLILFLMIALVAIMVFLSAWVYCKRR